MKDDSSGRKIASKNIVRIVTLGPLVEGLDFLAAALSARRRSCSSRRRWLANMPLFDGLPETGIPKLFRSATRQLQDLSTSRHLQKYQHLLNDAARQLLDPKFNA